jgi:general nucleoside transport system permease protein
VTTVALAGRVRELRPSLRGLAEVLVVLAGIVAAGGVLVAAAGADPVAVAEGIWTGAFGSTAAISETLLRFAPIVVIAVGLVPSLRAGLYNIGAPGQIAMGALGATLVALHLTALPSVLLIPLAAVAAGVFGALTALIPAVLKARLQINEVLTTLAFNFIVVYVLQYLLTVPLQGDNANLPQSDAIPAAAQLPILIPDTRAHIGVLVGLLAVVMLALFARTPSGYRWSLFGENRSLARQAGVSEPRLVVTVMCVGGAAAGLAGWMQVSGVDVRLYPEVADPIGYAGLFAALLGGLRALPILVAALFFGALLTGGESLQLGAGVAPEVISALVGLILFGVAARSAFGRRSPA